MANPFDQFDASPTQPRAASANPFDQFDPNPGAAHQGSNPFDQFDTGGGQEQQQFTRRTLTPAESKLDWWGKTAHGIADPTPGAMPTPWNFIYGLNGAYQDSVTHGLMMQPTRFVMENTPVGDALGGAFFGGSFSDRLRKMYPGQSEEFYRQKLHDLYRQAVVSARNQAHQQVVDNPYPGHQVGNFGANVLGSADPTWFIAPGAGAGKTALARVASRAGRMGLLGSASDDAAQLMDIAEGQQTGYNVERNLQSALFGAGFGGAHAGLSELGGTPMVSDFVKGLFGTRGIDTTPSADPRMSTSPMTGPDITMSPADREQFKGLLRTGSVDDIKQFLATKQGPKPTWQAVNKFVEMRDSMPPQYIGQDNFEQALTQHLDEAHKQIVSDHIDAQTQGWANKPDFEVINHTDEIQDPKVRAEAVAQGADNPNSLGFYGSDGKVRIFANRMESPDMLNSVLYHEGLGHHGLQVQFGDKLDSTLQTLMDRNVGRFGSEVDAWQKRNPNAYGGDRLRAAEEVLAQASENGPMKPAWHDAIVANLKQFGRKMGLNLAYSDAEIQHILALAHDAVINGKGRDAALNGFRGTKPTGEAPNSKWLNMSGEDPTADHAAQSKFMFTGPHAANFDPNHPTAMESFDSGPRNEIDDTNAKFNEPAPNSRSKLPDVLDHPELYENYPELRNVDVIHTDMQPGLQGSYSPKGNGRLYLSHDAVDKRSTTLHETQHAIQGLEKYPGWDGDNMNADEAAYGDDPLEHEAYATEERQNMSPDERAANKTMFATKSEMKAMGDYDIQQMERAYEATDKDYVPTVEPIAETQRKALDAGFSPSQIKAFGNTPELAKRIARITGAAKILDAKISGLLDKVDSPDWSPRDADALRQAIADHSYILTKMRDERAAVARALNISKMGYTRGQMESFGDLLREQGGTLSPLGDDDTLIRFARTLKTVAGGHNPNGMNAAISALSKPNWEDYLTTLHQNMMLSGLSTHVKAPTDMIIGIGRDLLNSTGALAHSGAVEALNAIPGVNLKPGIHPVESAMRMWGVLKAALDAGTYQRTAAAFGGNGPNPSGFGGKGNARIPIVSKVTDLISAQDAFFRSFATNMHLYGLAARDAVENARATGGKMDFDSLVNETSARARQPSSDLLKQAREAADTTLLLNKNALTEPLDRFKNTTNNSSALRRAGAFIANFLTPFVRVESNSLYNRVIRNSPLTMLDPQTYRELAKGGPEAGIALTRVFFALAPAMYYWQAAGKGQVTGEGPPNPAKRAEMEAGGWRPDAVHENGQYNTGDKLGTSLNPWDLHNAQATTIAGLREAYEQGANKGQVLTGLKTATLSTLKSLTQMSWVNDIAPAVDAFTAPNATMGQKVDKLAANEAATMVPNLVGQAARVSDQNQPDTTEPSLVPGTVKAAIPGLRETLPVKYDVYGEPVQGGASLAGQHTWMPQDNRVTGGNHVDETQDPAKQELQRLTGLVQGALVTAAPKTITVNGEKRQLDPREHGEYQKLMGRAVVETVRQEMGTQEWQNMSDQDRVLEVRDIVKDMRKAAKEQLYGQ